MRFGEIYNGDSDEDNVQNLQEFVEDLESDARAALYGALGAAVERLNNMPITDPRPGPGHAREVHAQEIIEDHLQQEREVNRDE